jgi:hypothetical protein
MHGFSLASAARSAPSRYSCMGVPSYFQVSNAGFTSVPRGRHVRSCLSSHPGVRGADDVAAAVGHLDRRGSSARSPTRCACSVRRSGPATSSASSCPDPRRLRRDPRRCG